MQAAADALEQWQADLFGELAQLADSVGWVRCRRWAARETLPSRVTASSRRSW